MASSSHLKPGDKGDISTKVLSEGAKGILVKTVTVISNDPQRPNITLTLKAVIKEPVSQPQP